MAGEKERKSVRAGSGITGYDREPTLLDDQYRDRAKRGALVPAEIRMTSAVPFQDFRREVEAIAREIYSKAALPDPFSFIHPDARYRAQSPAEMMWQGHDRFVKRWDWDSGWRQNGIARRRIILSFGMHRGWHGR